MKTSTDCKILTAGEKRFSANEYATNTLADTFLNLIPPPSPLVSLSGSDGGRAAQLSGSAEAARGQG